MFTNITVQQKSRIRGLFGFQYAEVQKNTSTEYKAGPKKNLPQAVGIKLTDNRENEDMYSDDQVEEPLSDFTFGEGELEIGRLAPQERNDLLDQMFTEGFLLKSGTDTPKEVAFSFMARMKDGLIEFNQLYVCVFNQGDEISYNTKTDKIEAKTNTLKFRYYRRKKTDVIDGKKKELYYLGLDETQMLEEYRSAQAAIDSFMTTVPEPPTRTGTVATGLTLTSAAGATAGTSKLTITPAKAAANSYKIKTATTVALPYVNADVSGWDDWDGTADVKALTGDDIVVVEADASGNVKKAGKIVAVAKA